MDRADVLIVGQGLAGTTLAWRLIELGASVVVADGFDAPSASRVAAGLLAPVGGKRLALAWQATAAWPAAVEFYRSIERLTQQALLTVSPIVRIFTDAEQQDAFQARQNGPLVPMIVDQHHGIDATDYDPGIGGFQALGARLNVAAYLDASRKAFVRRGAFVQQRVIMPEVTDRGDSIEVPQLGITTRRIVLCRGWSESHDAQFSQLRFEPAKGEVLGVRVPGLVEARTVQRGVWLAHREGDLFRAGATFDRDALDDLPTPQGRAEVEKKLRGFLKRPFRVVDHVAAVRPILRGRRPVAGELNSRPSVGLFNGLGASGTLWAPWVAGVYADQLTGASSALPAEVDVQRRFGS